ncbi:hypothetical protein HKCCSP123_07600 [Rhodobacterales bacterium HKCCSP123]|nr:hypothetical protein [Rhodobacterales bacterium HKCCSP123]
MTQGNRQARRAWAAARKKHMKRGHLYHVEFQHDPDCAIYTRERLCTCNPHRVLKDEAGRVLARVEGAGFYDPTELMEVTP